MATFVVNYHECGPLSLHYGIKLYFILSQHIKYNIHRYSNLCVTFVTVLPRNNFVYIQETYVNNCIIFLKSCLLVSMFFQVTHIFLLLPLNYNFLQT
jgi:hypothetical protein